MPPTWRGLLHAVYHRLARSRAAVRLARRLRNQCRTVIGYHVTALAGSIDAEANGEALVVRALAPGLRRFVDVGANVGEYAALVDAATEGRAEGLLIEPSGSALAELGARYGADPRMTVVAAAAADPAAPRELALYEEPRAGQTSTMVAGARTDASEARVVPVVTVDAQVAARGWDAVDLLKIDVEGFDLHVLRGAAGLIAARRVGVVQFEYNTHWIAAGSTLWGAIQLLEAAGYAVYLLTADGLRTFRYAELEEFYTYANFIAVAPERAEAMAPLMRGAIKI